MSAHAPRSTGPTLYDPSRLLDPRRRVRLAARIAPLALLLVVAALAPAAPGAAEAAPEPNVTDPEGDATEYNSKFAASRANEACWSAFPVSGAACEVVHEHGGPVAARPPAGGTPAPPSLDILSATLEEGPESLRVVLEVARLDEDLAGVAREDGPLGAQRGNLAVGWFYTDARACAESVHLHVRPDGGATSVLLASEACVGNERPADAPWWGGCNAWWWCEVAVPVQFEFGTPGRVVWTIPRELLVDGAEGTSLVGVHARSARAEAGIDVRSGYGVESGDREVAGWQRMDRYYEVDRTEEGAPLTFATPMRGTAPSSTATTYAADDDLDPLLDIVGLGVEETPTTLTLVGETASLDPSADVSHWWAMSLSDGTILEVWTVPGPDGLAGVARYTTRVQEGLLDTGAYLAYVDVEVRVEAGSPGRVRADLQRSDLPRIEAGSLSDLYIFVTGKTSAGVGTARDVGDAGRVWAGADGVDGEAAADYSWGFPVYRFLHDTPEAAYEGIYRMADATGDARMPDGLPSDVQARDRFDVTYVEAKMASATETHVTIGIHDLSRVAVPETYDGMFYAVGVETAGAATMIGYYHQKDEPAGVFLCAQDVTVLTEKHRDPTETVWTTLEGIVRSESGPARPSGSGSPGAVTVYVPNECFGPGVTEEITFDRFAAGTFLVRNGAVSQADGDARPVDAAEAPGPVTLRLASVPVPPTAWYVAPFGVEDFWDMAGIAVAGVVGLGGVAVRVHKRNVDKRTLADAKAREDRDVYRAALARAVASGQDPAKDEVLAALRRRLGISEREHAVLELEARAESGHTIAGPMAGTRFLGKYRIERLLGEGASARTYLARDEKLARRVVLKIARWPSPRETERALREARILARLEHPNVVKVHDVDEVADQGVIVLEFVPRGSLADRLREGPLALPEALALADGLLAGLEVAHAAGVVHQDVKPGNVLLTDDGRPKLADFGIARNAGGSGTVTGPTLAGAGAGTIRYMAPEQARGQAGDARSDLYAVGAVLYEALTGRACVDVDGLPEFEARAAVAERAPALPIPTVPAEVNALLAAFLAKDPAKRPQSASDARRRLAMAGQVTART